MLLKRSGEERLKMGCSMHATAQALARASIFERHPGARPADLKRLLFLHFYGTDFEPEMRKRIALALSKNSRPSKVLEVMKRTTRTPFDRINLPIVHSSGSDAVRDKTGMYGKTGKKKGKRSQQNRRRGGSV
jgi:hypothetical protein